MMPNELDENADAARRANAASLRLVAVGMLLGFASLAFAAQDDLGTNDLYIADLFTYDDNLYRLPSYLDITAVAGPLATRQDSFNTVSLGGDGRWFFSNQAIGVNFRADENRFSHNDSLNNVSGKGNFQWDWRLQANWSGQAGVSYYRALANFANTGYYARYVVEREDYFGTIRYQVGPHWALYGGAIGANTSQTAVAEQLYDFNSKAGNAGIEFATSSENTISWEYRYTDANFPQDFVLNGSPFNSNYKEDTTRILVKYVFTAATELDASAGYLKRDYPESGFATFSGDIWRAALQWQPTDKLQWVLTGWRQLTAYVDAESDYFVSNGASVASAWTATETLTLSLALSRENHDYIDSSPSAITFVSRRDKLTTEQARLIYTPTDSLAFNLTYRHDQHDSNQPRFQYDDTLATASVTYKIRP
jgi:hypothetical protein